MTPKDRKNTLWTDEGGVKKKKGKEEGEEEIGCNNEKKHGNGDEESGDMYSIGGYECVGAIYDFIIERDNIF